MQELKPHMSCVVQEHEFPQFVKEYPELYILTSTGIYRHINLKYDRHIRIKVDSIPNIKQEVKIGQELNFLPAGKIPYTLLEEIVQFFKDVMEIKKADEEAMAHILWNPTEGYHIGIPDQIVSKASVRYESDHIKKEDIIVLDIHSHNTMGAFFSGTDNNNDKIGFYYSGVVGKLRDQEPAFIWRFNVNEMKKECTIDEIFEIPKREIVTPTGWLDKVKTGGGYKVGKTSPGGWQGWEQRYYPGNEERKNHGRIVPAENTNLPDEIYDNLFGREVEFDFEPDAELVNMSPKDRNSSGSSVVVYEHGTASKKGPGASDANIMEFGKEAADAHEQIGLYLIDLEDNDELLLDLMRDIYGMLSTDGQGQLAHGGF